MYVFVNRRGGQMRVLYFGYFPTRVPEVPQDVRQNPIIVGVFAIRQLPNLAFVWADILGARCRLV